MPRKNFDNLINSCLHAQISKYEDDALYKLTVQINTHVTTEQRGNVSCVLWFCVLRNDVLYL